jgi:hypothetical protein
MLSNYCEKCKEPLYQGFARCQNPNCSALRKEFKDFADFVVATKGYCWFSGAPTDVKLPDGKYVWAADFFDYLRQGLISLDSEK